MKILKTEKQTVVSFMLISSLLMLTGCWGEKAKEEKAKEQASSSQVATAEKGEVLLSIDGKPVLYVDDFEDQKQMAQQSNQQLNMILQMMPDAEYSMLFKSIEAGHLMKEWVVRSGMDQKDNLVKERRQYHDAIDLQLYMKYYEDAHAIEVTEHEALAYYKAKRDQIPGLILSQGEVEIIYVNFDTKAKAEGFLAKIKDGSDKHVKAAAKEAGLTVKTMNVGSDTEINDALKNSVLAVTKFPAKEIVKMNDNSYWVVGMLKKKDTEYRSFDLPEIKQGITKMCKDEKREVELTKQVEKLNKEYNVVENKAYFDNKKKSQTHALKNAEQIIMQAQQEAADDVQGILLEDKI